MSGKITAAGEALTLGWQRVIEFTGAQEMDRLLDRGFVLHQKRMRRAQHQVISHAGEFCSFHRNLPIVGTRNHQAVDPVDGEFPRDDADLHGGRADSVGGGIGRGAEFATRRAVDLLEQPPRADFIHDFTALIGRAQHDDVSGVRERMPREIIADQNPAERVANEMDAGGASVFTVANGGREHGFAQSRDGVGARGISNVPDVITGGGEGAFHRVHRMRGATEAVEQYGVFIHGRSGQGRGRQGPGQKGQQVHPGKTADESAARHTINPSLHVRKMLCALGVVNLASGWRLGLRQTSAAFACHPDRRFIQPPRTGDGALRPQRQLIWAARQSGPTVEAVPGPGAPEF